MKQKELTQRLATAMNLSRTELTQLQDAFIAQIVEAVRNGNTVAVQGLGSFELKEKPARKMFNPTKNEYMEIPARQQLGFRPSGTLKTKINQ